MIPPHGAKLVERVLGDAEREDILARSAGLPRLRLNAASANDVENIATGVFSPLQGFMGRVDFHHVLNEMRLSNDLPWTIPLVLDVDKGEAAGLKTGFDVILTDASGDPLAVLRLEEKFEFDKEEMARKVFGTTDSGHRGAAKVLSMRDVLLSGKVDLIRKAPSPFPRFKLTPREARVLFREKGWRTVVGFEAASAPHLGHEYIQKSALAFADGVFIAPLVGRNKSGGYKDEVLLAAYEQLIRTYYPKERVVMAVLHLDDLGAGPREAVHKAIVFKNFGCTHALIGRDSAGDGAYYHPFAAQDIFEEFPDLGIVPLFYGAVSYCKKCRSVVNDRICPHPSADQAACDVTKIRDMFLRRETPPAELVRPEVAKVILNYRNPFHE